MIGRVSDPFPIASALYIPITRTPPAAAPARCVRAAAAYTCPRCNAPYCGLDCYKRHGQHCTEAFYR